MRIDRMNQIRGAENGEGELQLLRQKRGELRLLLSRGGGHPWNIAGNGRPVFSRKASRLKKTTRKKGDKTLHGASKESTTERKDAEGLKKGFGEEVWESLFEKGACLP